MTLQIYFKTSQDLEFSEISNPLRVALPMQHMKTRSKVVFTP
jgi:hypothetical protein